VQRGQRLIAGLLMNHRSHLHADLAVVAQFLQKAEIGNVIDASVAGRRN
jgi:hypothetical protein